MAGVVIAGTGSFLPQQVLTNHDFEMMVDTTDEWITTRTGIKERRICPRGMASSDMGVQSSLLACKDAGISSSAIDFIVCATVTPDMFFPSTACFIQTKLGVKNIPAFDISAACSGFIYALEVAKNLMLGAGYKTGLVVSSESMSRVTDYTDRNVCILLGDGAGAAVLKRSEEEGILGTYLSADGGYSALLNAPATGSKNTASFDTVEKRMHFMKMEGAPLFKIAILLMSEAINKLLDRFNLQKEDISLVIPHQANLRIIKGVAKNLKMPADKFYINIEKYGNMSAACIPVALDESSKKGLLKNGDLVMTVAFGGGLTWGANLIRWTK